MPRSPTRASGYLFASVFSRMPSSEQLRPARFSPFPAAGRDVVTSTRRSPRRPSCDVPSGRGLPALPSCHPQPFAAGVDKEWARCLSQLRPINRDRRNHDVVLQRHAAGERADAFELYPEVSAPVQHHEGIDVRRRLGVVASSGAVQDDGVQPRALCQLEFVNEVVERRTPRRNGSHRSVPMPRLTHTVDAMRSPATAAPVADSARCAQHHRGKTSAAQWTHGSAP